jgi:hypothetical protein
MASKTVETSVLDAAREYTRRGWRVVPIPHGKKGPRLHDWPSLMLGENEMAAHFSNGENIGILLGAASGGLVDIDFDCSEALDLADCFLSKTNCVFGRPSRVRSHRFYGCDPLPGPQKFSAPDGSTLVELRANGQQTLAPPSTHPSGETVFWSDHGNPTSVNADDLLRAVSLLAAAALLARHWPKPGQRHYAALALAGMLLRAWPEEEVARFIDAVAIASHDEETRQRIRDVISTSKRLAVGEAATGAPTLAQIVGDSVIARVRGWLGFGTRIETQSPALPSYTQPWPEPLASEAFHGLAGEIVHAIEPHTEADPAALLIQLLTAFGNVVGRNRFFVVERHHHYTNLFSLIVGSTSKGRKGVSWSQIAESFRVVDDFWISMRVHGGIGSGEGIIWQVRDPILKGEKIVDEGIGDKRLLLLETEFAQVLAVMKREGGTVSEVLRRAWDGTPLQTLTKNSPARATGAHVSLIGHITRDELVRHLDQTEIANGLVNRFIFCCARRSKKLPDGGALDDSQIAPLSEKLRLAIAFARESGEMKRDESAAALWREIYGDLSEGRHGLLGAIISRAEAQVLRLSMIFALLDSSATIRREHLIAAVAIWQYAEASANYVFGDSLGDPVGDEILRVVRATPTGLTRSEVRDLFGRNKKEAEIDRAVSVLLSLGFIEIRTEATGGRPAQRLTARRLSYDKNDFNDQSRPR